MIEAGRGARISSGSDGDGRAVRFVARLSTVATVVLAGIALASTLRARGAGYDTLANFIPLVAAVLTGAGAVAMILMRSQAGRWGIGLVALAGLVAAGALMAPEYERTIPQAPAGAKRTLRVLTFNVWRQNADPDGTIAAILAADADVVLLQEMEGAVGDRAAALAKRYPYRTPCTRCGDVIFSKRPITGARAIHDEHGRPVPRSPLLARTTAPDGGPVTLVTTHYTWPLPGYGQEDQRRRLRRALRFVDPANLILTADMNLTPWTDAMARQDAAFAPLVRQTRGEFSWPARTGGGMRVPFPPFLAIDHIYAGPQWRQVRVTRLGVTGSDHYPILAVLARR